VKSGGEEKTPRKPISGGGPGNRRKMGAGSLTYEEFRRRPFQEPEKSVTENRFRLTRAVSLGRVIEQLAKSFQRGQMRKTRTTELRERRCSTDLNSEAPEEKRKKPRREGEKEGRKDIRSSGRQEKKQNVSGRRKGKHLRRNGGV